MITGLMHEMDTDNYPALGWPNIRIRHLAAHPLRMAVPSLTAATEEVPANQWRIGIQFDNDLFASDDRNHTSGAHGTDPET